MSEIEEFEKWLAKSGISYRRDVALGSWQACAELKDKRINELEAELVEQAKVLVANVTNQLKLEAESAVIRESKKCLQASFFEVNADHDALKAKFAELEKQEPVAEVTSDCFAGLYDILPLGTPLYAEPVIPDLERKLLEARIGQTEYLRNAYPTDSKGSYIHSSCLVKELKELRAQLASLNKGE